MLGAQSVGDQLSEAGVTLQEPAARGNAVGHIREKVAALVLDKVAEDGSLKKLAVQLGDTVDFERANNGEVGHADKLAVALLDDGHAPDTVNVAREALGDVVEEVQVDHVDDLQVAGQEVLEERNRPLFEGLGKNGVVGVRENLGGDLPGDIVGDLLLVDKDAHELHNSDRRVGVVH